MLRARAGCLVSFGNVGCKPASTFSFRRVLGPRLIWIGPVTCCRTRLEKEIFSKRDPSLPWNLMGHPKTSYRTQLETERCSAPPPPKRKTDHRVLKTEFVTVMNLQLPNIAQASSCDRIVQLLTVTYSALMK